MIPEPGTPQLWHVLTESSVPAAEFSLALSRLADVIAWVPQMSGLGWIQNWTETEHSDESKRLRRVRFPLQRGFSRFPLAQMPAAYRSIHALLMRETECAPRTGLICTSSFYARVAAMWEGPIVYYATDYTFAYDGLSSDRVLSADREMCAVADLVCPNSTRLATYFIDRCGCPAERITVLPNATRAANLRSCPSQGPDPLPGDLPPISRPVAGVIGSMAANLDWKMLSDLIEKAPAYTWLFVGPSSMPIREADVRGARARVMKMPGTVFVGAKPYKNLVDYARAVDVAVMPYMKREPTYSGSATRFYEHLAAGRPILSTRGVEELLQKEPLLHLADTADQMAHELELLLKSKGQDGYEQARFFASQTETWERRTETMIYSLRQHTLAKHRPSVSSGVLQDSHHVAGSAR